MLSDCFFLEKCTCVNQKYFSKGQKKIQKGKENIPEWLTAH